MDKDKQVQKVQKYVVEKIVKRDNLLIRGLREVRIVNFNIKVDF